MSVGSLRKSSRLSAAVLPQASPSSNYLSPRRVIRRSLALAQTPAHATASPAQPVRTPAHVCLTLNQTPAQAPESRRGTPQSSQKRKDAVNVSLCFSPVKEVLSDDNQPNGNPECQSEKVSEVNMPTHLLSLPSISVVEEQGTPAEAVNVHLPLSPCKALPPVSQAPEPSSSLSFMLSPCMTSSLALTSSPPAVEAQESVCRTPDSSVVEVKTFRLHQSLVSVLKNGSHIECHFITPVVLSCSTIKELFSCNFRKFLGWTLSVTSSLH